MEFRSESVHVQVLGAATDAAQQILTPDCLRFVGTLCAQFEDRRQSLLQARVTRAAALDAGEEPQYVQNHPAKLGNWKCAPVPADIQDRRVEITGPVDRKMVRVVLLHAAISSSQTICVPFL